MRHERGAAGRTGWARTSRNPGTCLLRRALKAFEKTLRTTQLADESGLGGRGMTSGRSSGIVGIQPPARFSREVWNELVRQGRLRGGRQGIYEPGTG